MKYLHSIIAIILFVSFSYSQNNRIDINNINAIALPQGSMFYPFQNSMPGFEISKNTGKSTIFASSLWIGGLRPDSSLGCVYETFFDTNTQSVYSTGPLSVVAGSGTGGSKDFGPATISASEKAKWNEVFCVNKLDIEIFIRWYNCSQDPSCDVSVSFPGYSVPTSITTWPAHGDVSLFQDYYLAPFFDKNLDGDYNPVDGDYPCIKGDQYCWYIINDRGYDNSSFGMGMEIQVEMYSYKKDSLNPLSNTLFVGYDVINRSTTTYREFKLAQKTDFDIGCAADDYIGSMPSINSYYGYNGDAVDDFCSGGAQPFGINPPAQGVTFLNNTMSNSMYYTNSFGNQGDPNNEIEAFRYMHGQWKDGVKLKYGGNGYPAPIGTATGPDTNHMFPYNSTWTEVTAGNPPGDRRFVGAVSKSLLGPGEIFEVDLAFTYSRSDSGHLKSVDKLYRDIQTVQQFYNDSIPSSCQAFVLSTPELELLNIKLFPNPTTNSFTIESELSNLQADIISVDGKLISSNIDLNQHSTIDASAWENGLYLVKIYDTKGNFKVLRMIKN